MAALAESRVCLTSDPTRLGVHRNEFEAGAADEEVEIAEAFRSEDDHEDHEDTKNRNRSPDRASVETRR